EEADNTLANKTGSKRRRVLRRFPSQRMEKDAVNGQWILGRGENVQFYHGASFSAFRNEAIDHRPGAHRPCPWIRGKLREEHVDAHFPIRRLPFAEHYAYLLRRWMETNDLAIFA